MRPEFGRTGVYVLIGSDESTTLPKIYIGEGGPIGPRLRSHQRKKDFWEQAVFFVSKDESLNKAHVKHLESRLISLATEAKRCSLDNATGSETPTLSEIETADVEGFLANMLSIFPLIGLPMFEKDEAALASDQVFLSIQAKGIEAKGYEESGGFVVCEGSQVVIEETSSCHAYLRDLRRDLKTQGGLTEAPGSDHWVNVVALRKTAELGLES